jgi:methionine-S-sulfoxide reductase
MQTIGILGTGTVGDALADGFLKHGYAVVRGSRDPRNSRRGRVAGAHGDGYVRRRGEVGLWSLAVKGTAGTRCPWGRAPRGQDRDRRDEPHRRRPLKDGVLSFFTTHAESLMERLARRAPKARFVKAFSCVGSAFMVNPKFPGGELPTMFICGDDAAAKQQVRAILTQFGWDAEDVGGVASARAIEPLCILWCLPGFLRNQWTIPAPLPGPDETEAARRTDWDGGSRIWCSRREARPAPHVMRVPPSPPCSRSPRRRATPHRPPRRAEGATPAPAATRPADAPKSPPCHDDAPRPVAEGLARRRRALQCTRRVPSPEGRPRRRPGYAGGTVENPTWRASAAARPHAEVIQVRFDPAQVKYEQLLEVFFKTHDPTTLNRQGADVGTQYRSVIFTHDDAQKKTAEEVKAALDAAKAFDRPIVTEITPYKAFYKAEDYHQGYYDANPRAGYCRVVIAPKLEKLESVCGPRRAVGSVRAVARPAGPAGPVGRAALAGGPRDPHRGPYPPGL